MSRMRVPCQDPPPHPRSKTHLMVRKAYPAFRALPEVAPAQAPCHSRALWAGGTYRPPLAASSSHSAWLLRVPPPWAESFLLPNPQHPTLPLFTGRAGCWRVPEMDHCLHSQGRPHSSVPPTNFYHPPRAQLEHPSSPKPSPTGTPGSAIPTLLWASTVPGLLSVTPAPSQGRAQTSCPVRIRGWPSGERNRSPEGAGTAP